MREYGSIISIMPVNLPDIDNVARYDYTPQPFNSLLHLIVYT